MKNYPLWKIFIVFILVSLGVVFAIPSILYQEDTGNWYLDNRLNLGLDLQGGSYLLLEVQTDVLIEEEFENFSDISCMNIFPNNCFKESIIYVYEK